jgi:hypothetical protein
MGVPTQSHPQAASRTLSAWNIAASIDKTQNGAESEHALRRFLYVPGSLYCN